MVNERVALVTGGSRGIGRGIALALGAKGWHIAVNYRGNADAAQETVASIQASGGEAIAIQADLGDLSQHPALIQTVMETYGRIDALVNNAGMAPRQRVDILQTSPESYDEVMGVNLKAPFFLTQHISRIMIDMIQAAKLTPPLYIINMGSISSYTSSLSRSEYCVSKAGMTMMTRLFADRLADEGILVYELSPGIIATDMTQAVSEKYAKLIAEGLTPVRRFGQPADVGQAVVALVEGFFPFSTGEVINIDGGFHMRRL